LLFREIVRLHGMPRPLFQIEIQSSWVTFGRHYGQNLEQDYCFLQLVTCKQTDKQRL
jgi:hypothetical protein